MPISNGSVIVAQPCNHLFPFWLPDIGGHVAKRSPNAARKVKTESIWQEYCDLATGSHYEHPLHRPLTRSYVPSSAMGLFTSFTTISVPSRGSWNLSSPCSRCPLSGECIVVTTTREPKEVLERNVEEVLERNVEKILEYNVEEVLEHNVEEALDRNVEEVLELNVEEVLEHILSSSRGSVLSFSTCSSDSLPIRKCSQDNASKLAKLDLK
ncbi:hypothetical protein AVEN_83568-1 [Araneus ventricosus]|uniref:Uncharacterized protein n=1 Tax=Araneus ventricosus TaxID=182803 RepID=A0A4Y2LEC1_ARAVE|nr:hypothetical protein AVEN_83568-1 [Araneus ventricosus]